MKNLIYILLLFNCVLNAQSPVLPLKGGEPLIDGAYYKDMDYDLNNFVGTWQFTNGTTSLTLKMKKVTMYHDIVYNRYIDLIVGEYKYVENGVEKINTLPQFNQSMDPYDHNIVGSVLIGEFARGLRVIFSQPDISINGLESVMRLKRADTTMAMKINVEFTMTDGPIYEEGQPDPFNGYAVPFGEYVLTKMIE